MSTEWSEAAAAESAAILRTFKAKDRRLPVRHFPFSGQAAEPRLWDV